MACFSLLAIKNTVTHYLNVDLITWEILIDSNFVKVMLIMWQCCHIHCDIFQARFKSRLMLPAIPHFPWPHSGVNPFLKTKGNGHWVWVHSQNPVDLMCIDIQRLVNQNHWYDQQDMNATLPFHLLLLIWQSQWTKNLKIQPLPVDPRGAVLFWVP